MIVNKNEVSRFRRLLTQRKKPDEKAYTLNKNKVAGFLDKLVADYQVFAPMTQNGTVNFKEIDSGSQMALDYLNSTLPPKGILFPQSETLFSYTRGEEDIQLKEHLDERKKIIFGIRPCDARSLVLLDNVFYGDKYQDTYYLKKRQNTILVGIGCNKPLTTCFCTSLGGGPFEIEGLDLLLVDTGGNYLVQVLTEEGEKLVAGFNLRDAGESDLAKAAEVKKNATVLSTVNTTGLKEKLDNMFYHPVWDLIFEKCIGCAACSYLCPTCHCFDIIDEALDKSGCRIRNWDSCMFPLFTLHGSGHNPRLSGKERWRQRTMHKFKYFVDNFKKIACVGCGRCIKNCPVNLDIRQVVATIQEQDS